MLRNVTRPTLKIDLHGSKLRNDSTDAILIYALQETLVSFGLPILQVEVMYRQQFLLQERAFFTRRLLAISPTKDTKEAIAEVTAVFRHRFFSNDFIAKASQVGISTAAYFNRTNDCETLSPLNMELQFLANFHSCKWTLVHRMLLDEILHSHSIRMYPRDILK